jgi:hypothetical protein
VVPHQSGAASRSAALRHTLALQSGKPAPNVFDQASGAERDQAALAVYHAKEPNVFAKAFGYATEPNAFDQAFGNVLDDSHGQQSGNVSFSSGNSSDSAASPSAVDNQGKRKADPLPGPGAKKGKARAQTPEYVPEAPPGSPHDPVLDVPSGPAAEPGAHPPKKPASFVLPDEMRLAQNIHRSLQNLQTALNAVPGAADLFRETRHTAFPQLKDVSRPLTSMARFDTYLTTHGVRLADALADVCTFQGHAQAAVERGVDISHLRSLRGACFPDTPVRKVVRDLLRTDPAFNNLRRSGPERYLHLGTDIDVHLAKKGLHFADVCRADGAKGDAENTTRAALFRQMKDDMLAGAPNENMLKTLLRTLRVRLHRLPQDGDLAILIGNVEFADRREVRVESIKRWRGMAREVAEVLADGGVNVATFVATVRAGGTTGAARLVNFKANEDPFPGSGLTHATIVAKLGTASDFNGMLQHICRNANMATILAGPAS